VVKPVALFATKGLVKWNGTWVTEEEEEERGLINAE
jgi:hypothetical protein